MRLVVLYQKIQNFLYIKITYTNYKKIHFELIDINIYNIYKQFNDIRNMLIHEDYMALILSLKVEELQKIIQLLKLVELSNIHLMRIHNGKIGPLIKKYTADETDLLRKINMAEEFFLGQCLEVLEENRLKNLKEKEEK